MSFLSKKELENYIPKKVPANNRKGYTIEYEYHGDWVIWDCTDRERRRCKYLLLIGQTVLVFLSVLGGIQYTVCNTLSSVAVPSILSLLALLIAFIGILSFSWKQSRMPNYDFRVVHLQIEAGLLINGLLQAFSTVFCMIFLLTHPVPSLGKELFVSVCHLICCLISILLLLIIHRLSYHVKAGS